MAVGFCSILSSHTMKTLDSDSSPILNREFRSSLQVKNWKTSVPTAPLDSMIIFCSHKKHPHLPKKIQGCPQPSVYPSLYEPYKKTGVTWRCPPHHRSHQNPEARARGDGEESWVPSRHGKTPRVPVCHTVGYPLGGVQLEWSFHSFPENKKKSKHKITGPKIFGNKKSEGYEKIEVVLYKLIPSILRLKKTPETHFPKTHLQFAGSFQSGQLCFLKRIPEAFKRKIRGENTAGSGALGW